MTARKMFEAARKTSGVKGLFVVKYGLTVDYGGEDMWDTIDRNQEDAEFIVDYRDGAGSIVVNSFLPAYTREVFVQCAGPYFAENAGLAWDTLHRYAEVGVDHVEIQ